MVIKFSGVNNYPKAGAKNAGFFADRNIKWESPGVETPGLYGYGSD
jgi:hypothetical protein